MTLQHFKENIVFRMFLIVLFCCYNQENYTKYETGAKMHRLHILYNLHCFVHVRMDCSMHHLI